MAVETVQVAIDDDQVVPQPVDGVVARIFDDEGTFITTATSGALMDGELQVDLPGSSSGDVYELRFFKLGVALPPKAISVYSPPSLAPTGTNKFVVTAEVFRLVPSPDTRMCRVSGFVSNAAGRQRRGVTLVVIPQFNAFIAEPTVVTPGRFIVKTDAEGYCSFDLFRSAMYTITVEGQEEVTRSVRVPDRATVALTALLFPVVTLVEFAEGLGPFVLLAGASLVLTPTITTTDYRVLVGSGAEDVGYWIDDPSIASVYILSDRIEVRGITAGTTTLRLSRLDASVVSLPDPGIRGGLVTITVV
jgi:hypothetical protein